MHVNSNKKRKVYTEKHAAIRQALETLGTSNDYALIVPDKVDIVEKTAAEELQNFLKKCSLNVKVLAEIVAREGKGFVLGRLENSRIINRMNAAGRLRIGKISPEDDGYHLKRIGNQIIVAGANPRGVLYGVYRLMEWIMTGAGGKLDLLEKPFFKERWAYPGIGIENEVSPAVRYLARMGVSTAYLRGLRAEWRSSMRPCTTRISDYVSEREHIPALAEFEPVDKNAIKQMDEVHELSRLYGMANVLWAAEPEVVGVKALKSVPQDMTSQPALARLRSGGTRSLCLSHPKVQDHYAALMKELLSRYPRLKAILVYNEDENSSNCYPPSCSRCRKLYPNGYTGYPYQAHLQGIKILQSAGRRTNPGFSVASATYHWYITKYLRKAMIDNLPPNAIVCCLNAEDSQVAISNIPAWTKKIAKMVKKRGDLTLMALDDFNASSEDMLMELTDGFPAPYRTYKKLHNWALAGAKGITDHPLSGPSLKVNGINDIAYRVFSWDPLMSTDKADAKIRDITRLQLGDRKAADEMIRAYRAIDKALDVGEKCVVGADRKHTWLSKHTWLYMAINKDKALDVGEKSAVGAARLWHGWTSYMRIPLTPDTIEQIKVMVKGYWPGWFNPNGKEIAFLEQALAHARNATNLAPDDVRPVYLWFDSDDPITCREYAEMQAETIEIVMRAKQSVAHFMEAATLNRGNGNRLYVLARRELGNSEKLLDVLMQHRKWIKSDDFRKDMQRFIAETSKKISCMESFITNDQHDKYRYISR